MTLFEVPLEEKKKTETIYSKSVKVPHYEIKGKMPIVQELVDTSKYRELMANINKSNVSEAEKDFLRMGACRHLVFNYAKIAEYYAGASKEMQELMEQSALVIIDINNAIANGYVRLTEHLQDLISDSSPSKSGD